MWDSRHVRWLMLALLFVPLAIGNWALAVPVVERPHIAIPAQTVAYDHEPLGHTWQHGPEFNAGTASALVRPPGGFPHEQPIPKPHREIVMPDLDREIHKVTIDTREPFRFVRDL